MDPRPLWPLAQPVTSAEAQVAEADYLARLGDELHRTMEWGIDSLTDLFRAGLGATPDIILDILNGSHNPADIPSNIRPAEVIVEDPELHPLLFEWYFDSASARFVAEVGLGAGHDILCLGTPSVASQLATASVRPDVTLVDADESVANRFPSLSKARVHVGELGSFRLSRSYSVVIADPPWYFEDTMRWLEVAATAVRDGGTIVLPLFPELTRPSATRERTRILAEAGSLGQVELWNGRVTYRTPGFERHALAALGVKDTGDWRQGDLLAIRHVSHLSKPWPTSRVHMGLEGWRRFTVGPQVVMLRDIETTSQSPVTFLPIAGCPRNVLTSVSERDPRRSLVGLWTSRNRVAAVGDVAKAARLLEFIAGDSHEVPRDAGSAWTFLQNLLLAR